MTPFAALAPLEIAFILHTGIASNSEAYALLHETNPEELREFAAGLGWIFVASFFSLGMSLGSGYLLRRSKIQWQHWSSVVAPITFLALMANAVHIDQSHSDPSINAQLGGRLFSGSTQSTQNSYPLGLPQRLNEFAINWDALTASVEAKYHFRFHAQRNSDLPSAADLVVLVIGESSRADHWALNGYNRDTNPHLSRRAGLISFSEFYSPWTFSRLAVPVILTRRPPMERDYKFAESSIVSLYKEAGFRTDWISLQGKVGLYDSPISVYAYESEKTHFLNPAGFTGQLVRDDAVLPVLDKVLAENGKNPTFVAIHLLGSHYNYARRYPTSFDKFRPSLNDAINPNIRDSGMKEELTNSYDNSILFTDYVLDEIITKLQTTQKKAFLLYVSDHGEDLFESCSGGNKSLHGNETLFGHWVSAFSWASTELRTANPSLMEKLARHSASPLSTTVVFDTLADIGGIRYPDARLNMSILSDQFTPPHELKSIPTLEDDKICASLAAKAMRAKQ